MEAKDFFVVLNREAIQSFTLQEPYIVISFYGSSNIPSVLLKDDNRKGELFIQCDDIEQPISVMPNLILFNENMARDILEFVIKWLPFVNKIVNQ